MSAADTRRDAGPAAPPIGVLVVHGIGEQRPGETLQKLLAGLSRVDADGVPTEAASGTSGSIAGQPVRFYEVYWADLLNGKLAAGAFQMSELQSVAWFPLLNACRGNYSAGSYSFLRLAKWCVLLPVLNVFMLLGYYGAMLIGELVARIRETERPREDDAGKTFMERVRASRDRTTKHTLLAKLLDEYAGDVFSYVNSAGRAFHREREEPAVPAEVEDVYVRLMRRFYAELTRAAGECDSIQIVAHSLGTVVTFHALSGLRLEADGTGEPERVRAAIAKVRHLYTIGSPLEKIRFLWPRLMPGRAFHALDHVQWDNFVSWFDPVAGMLRRFEHWGEVRNHRLLGGGFISGHVVYERSAPFLKVLTVGLTGREIPLNESPGERRRDRLVLLGETLIAPALIALAVALGAGVLFASAALVPWLASLPLRLFLDREVWSPWFDNAMLVFGSMMAVALIVAPIVRASRVHARYWTRRDG